MSECIMVGDIDYNEIEPGIRGAVAWLRRLGIMTTQSCEGHEDERAPYVLAHYETSDAAVKAGLQVRASMPEGVHVELMYGWELAEDSRWFLLVTETREGALRELK